MKVIEVNPLCGYGCTGRIATDLQHLLESQGHTCVVAYNREPSIECNKYRIGNKITMYTHALYTRLFDRQGFFSKHEMNQFIHFMDDYKPDLIHLHVIHGNYIHVPMLIDYINRKHIAVVYTFHDCWAFTGHCVYFDYINCDRYKSGCHNCPKLHVHPASWLIDQSKRNYNDKKRLFTSIENLHIVTPSKWLADLTRQSFLKDLPIHVIPNGIDTDEFSPIKSDIRKKFNIDNKIVLMGCSNGWAPTKGLDDFIYLSSKLDMSKYAIILVGLKDHQLNTLPASIIGIQKTDSIKELAELYSAADIFLNPTYEDNFPTTNLEALACGTPVITYHTGGSPESIDSSCGQAVTQGDKDALLQAVYNIAESSIDSSHCRNRALQYAKNVQYQKYISLFESITT